jgi:hypothetical protein
MRRSSKSSGRTRPEVAIDDVSRDVSQGGDRGLWLLEFCPACGASPGARCRRARGASRQPILHVARGWRQRRCPVCQAGPGEACVSPSGRTASGPHAVRRSPARGELGVIEDVWRVLARISATVARVRFAGGGGRRASVETMVAAAGGGELARWRAGEGELGDALAAPVWARYGAFRGQPPITGTLSWSVAKRSITLAGRRGGERFAETLAGGAAIRSGRDVSRDASPVSALERRACERCGGPIAERPVGGALLLEALSAGRLARQAARVVGTAGPGGARALRVVRGSDARGVAVGGALLLEALSAGRLARQAGRGTGVAGRGRTRRHRATRVARRVAVG